jgi:integrase
MTLSKNNLDEINKLFKLYKKQMSKNEKNILVKKIINYIMKNYKNERTITNKVSLIKKMAQEKFKDKEFTALLVPKKEITQKARADNNKLQEKRKRLDISKDLINKLFSFHDSKNISELIFYLLFMTGRRISELLTAKFINKKKCKGVYISGLKKKRNKEDSNKEYCIYVIDPKTKVLRSYDKMKKKISGKNLDNLTRKLNRDIKKLDPRFKLHILRSLYANYLYKYRNKENLNFNGFIKEKLNHTTLSSSFGYNFIHFL